MTPGKLPRQARTRWRATTEHRASSPSSRRSYGGAEPAGTVGAAEPQATSQHNTRRRDHQEAAYIGHNPELGPIPAPKPRTYNHAVLDKRTASRAAGHREQSNSSGSNKEP